MRPGVCPSVCLSVQCLDLTRERKALGSPKLPEWKPITQVTSEPIRGSRSQGRLMLSPKMCHIFRTGRHTNFKLGMEHEDPHHWQAPWPPRSKVTVAISRAASERCWPISREWKIHRNTKMGRKVAYPTGNNAHQVRGKKLKGQEAV